MNSLWGVGMAMAVYGLTNPTLMNIERNHNQHAAEREAVAVAPTVEASATAE